MEFSCCTPAINKELGEKFTDVSVVFMLEETKAAIHSTPSFVSMYGCLRSLLLAQLIILNTISYGCIEQHTSPFFSQAFQSPVQYNQQCRHKLGGRQRKWDIQGLCCNPISLQTIRLPYYPAIPLNQAQFISQDNANNSYTFVYIQFLSGHRWYFFLTYDRRGGEPP